jgi:hypothetical protein
MSTTWRRGDWLASQYRRAAEAIDAQMLPGQPIDSSGSSVVDGQGERSAAGLGLG